MFFLGKRKVEQGIPLLLQYLDYQYTTSPLPTEEFPALHALIAMGEPAAKAAVESLGKEKDNQRLALLCRLIVDVNGAAEGQKRIKAALPSVQDKAQQSKIQGALESVLVSPDLPSNLSLNDTFP